MGLLGKLIKTGVAAGAAYAAVKIGEKYKEKNGDVTPEDKLQAFKDAASEVYEEASEFAKDKAPAVTAKAEELFDKAKEAMPGVISTVSEKAQEAVAYAKDKAPGMTAKAEELWGKAKDYVSTFTEAPVDGEVVDFEDAGMKDIEVEIVEDEAFEEAAPAAEADAACTCCTAEEDDYILSGEGPAREDTVEF